MEGCSSGCRIADREGVKLGDRSFRSLDRLNRSIDRKLEQIEGHTAAPSNASQRSGKSGTLAEGSSVKPPRMIQKQRVAHPIHSPAMLPDRTAIAASRIWSQQNLLPEALFQARYKLIGGSYVEEQAPDFTQDESPIMIVEMGDLKTVTGDALIQTRSMTHCSSIVLLTDFDPDKKTYGIRSLVHMQGSNLVSMEEPEKIADTLSAQAKASKGRPLMILATGIVSSSWLIESMVIPVAFCSEAGVVRQPLLELMALCDTMILPLTLNLTVMPDASLLATHEYSLRDNWKSE